MIFRQHSQMAGFKGILGGIGMKLSSRVRVKEETVPILTYDPTGHLRVVLDNGVVYKLFLHTCWTKKVEQYQEIAKAYKH